MFYWDKISFTTGKGKEWDTSSLCLPILDAKQLKKTEKFSQLSGYFSLSYKKIGYRRYPEFYHCLVVSQKVIVIHKCGVISMNNKPSCQSKVLFCIDLVSDILGFALRYEVHANYGKFKDSTATGKYILIELDFPGKWTLEQKHKMQVSKYYNFLNKEDSFWRRKEKYNFIIIQTHFPFGQIHSLWFCNWGRENSKRYKT